MLEVFAYKRYKKHKLAKELREQNAKEALSKQDEEFIRKSIVSNHDSSDQAKSAMNPLSRFLHKGKSTGTTVPPLTPEELAAIKAKDEGTTTPTSQEEDLSRALSSLNLAVEKKTAFSLSDETRALLKEFTQILKDIQSGGPHAYSDLNNFLHKSNAQLNSKFDSIPGFLKSLISTLPFPLARKLDKKSPKEVGVDILKDLAKPGVITGLLRNIMNVLRTRFPAFVGSNALLSLGVFVLLLGVWYCYKRGREERKKLEGASTNDEVLVEGAEPQDSVDHGVGTTIGHTGEPSSSTNPDGLESTTVLRNIQLEMKPVDDNDTPVQVESDRVPSPVLKKARRSWLKST